MAIVKMHIEKFGREVLIDDAHPLVIAQRTADAEAAREAARQAAKANSGRSPKKQAPDPDVEADGS